MKTLDINQIAEINQLLINKYEFDEEFRQELLDHLACEIEEKMNETNCSFQEAFQLVRSKWKPRLSTSLFGKGIPKFIVKSLVKNELKSIFYALLFLGLIFLFVQFNLRFPLNEIGFYCMIFGGTLFFIGMLTIRVTSKMNSPKTLFYKIILVWFLLLTCICTVLLNFNINNKEWAFFPNNSLVIISLLINCLAVFYYVKVIKESRNISVKKQSF